MEIRNSCAVALFIIAFGSAMAGAWWMGQALSASSSQPPTFAFVAFAVAVGALTIRCK
jgi:hypothetical protein